MAMNIWEKIDHNKELTENYEANKISYADYKKSWKNIDEKQYAEAVKKSQKRNAVIRSRVAEKYILPSIQKPAQAPAPAPSSPAQLQAGDPVTITKDNRTFTGSVYNTPGGNRIAVGVRSPTLLEIAPSPQSKLPPGYLPLVASNPVTRAAVGNPIASATQNITGIKYYYTGEFTSTPKPAAAPSNSGSMPNTIGAISDFKKTTLMDRINQDSRLNIPASETISREAGSIANELSVKYEKAKGIQKQSIFVGRAIVEGVKFATEDRDRTFKLVGLGAAYTGVGAAGGIISGAFPKVAPAITGIMQGVASIGGALYIPSVAQQFSDSTNYAKTLGKVGAEISLVKLGSAPLEQYLPKIKKTKITDSSSNTQRLDLKTKGKEKIVDLNKIKTELKTETQYLKQTTKLKGSEKQTSYLNPINQEQIISKSSFNIKGEISYEPQGASKTLRGIFTKKAPSSTPIDIKGESSGVFNLLKKNYVQGVSEVTQKSYLGDRKTIRTEKVNSKQYAEYLAKKGSIKDLKEVEMWGNDGVYTPEFKRMRIDSKLKGDDLLRAYSHELIHFKLGEKGLYKVTTLFLKSKNPIANKVGEKLIDFEEGIAFKNENPKAQYKVKIEKKIYSDPSSYTTESFYRAAPNKDGLMQFSGARGSSFGSSSEFRGAEQIKYNVYNYQSSSIDASIISTSEKGFINKRLEFVPKSLKAPPGSKIDLSFLDLNKIGKTGSLGRSNLIKLNTISEPIQQPGSISLDQTLYLKNFDPFSILQQPKSMLLPVSISTSKTNSRIMQQNKLRSETSQISRVSQITSITPSQITKPISITKTQQSLKLSNVVKLNNLFKIGSITQQIPKIAQITKTAKITSTTTLTPRITITPIINPPGAPFVPPIVPPVMDLGLNFGFGRSRAGKISQKTQYKPNLRSLLFNIRGKMPKVITPFSNRPILRGG